MIWYTPEATAIFRWLYAIYQYVWVVWREGGDATDDVFDYGCGLVNVISHHWRVGFIINLLLNAENHRGDSRRWRHASLPF